MIARPLTTRVALAARPPVTRPGGSRPGGRAARATQPLPPLHNPPGTKARLRSFGWGALLLGSLLANRGDADCDSQGGNRPAPPASELKGQPPLKGALVIVGGGGVPDAARKMFVE